MKKKLKWIIPAAILLFILAAVMINVLRYPRVSPADPDIYRAPVTEDAYKKASAEIVTVDIIPE